MDRQRFPGVTHENAVYLALRRKGRVLSYAGEKDAWECDFVTDRESIQVCAELTPHNRERELKGLVKASRLPGRRQALLLTLNQRETLVADGLKIEVKPAWEWMMEQDREYGLADTTTA